MIEIIQIVSRLPPSVDGVGDYAFLLAQELRAIHSIHTIFVVCGCKRKISLERKEETIDGFTVFYLESGDGRGLAAILSNGGMPRTVLLQYVGYGYEKRGCPLWLVRGLDKWLQADCDNRLLTMFHELYAFGPPWRSSFWTSPLQRWITRTLARSSSRCITNMNQSKRVLVAMSGHIASDFSVLPVFSNVGEPDELPDWNERGNRMIVFGSKGWREKVYRDHVADLEKICRRFAFTEIVDIGPVCAIPTLSVPCAQKGRLSPSEVSQEMLNARAGFFSYPIPYLAKSGIFAAYCAHGVAPLTFGDNTALNEDGIEAGEHYLTAGDLSSDLKAIGERAWSRYRQLRIAAQANHYKEILYSLTVEVEADHSI